MCGQCTPETRTTALSSLLHKAPLVPTVVSTAFITMKIMHGLLALSFHVTHLDIISKNDIARSMRSSSVSHGTVDLVSCALGFSCCTGGNLRLAPCPGCLGGLESGCGPRTLEKAVCTNFHCDQRVPKARSTVDGVGSLVLFLRIC